MVFWEFFNKTIIPLVLVGYEMIITNSYSTRTRGIIVEYTAKHCKDHFRERDRDLTICLALVIYFQSSPLNTLRAECPSVFFEEENKSEKGALPESRQAF